MVLKFLHSFRDFNCVFLHILWKHIEFYKYKFQTFSCSKSINLYTNKGGSVFTIWPTGTNTRSSQTTQSYNYFGWSILRSLQRRSTTKFMQNLCFASDYFMCFRQRGTHNKTQQMHHAIPHEFYRRRPYLAIKATQFRSYNIPQNRSNFTFQLGHHSLQFVVRILFSHARGKHNK